MEARRQCDPALTEISGLRSVTASGPARPCIMLDQVSLLFHSERREVQALSDISLTIADGELGYYSLARAASLDEPARR